MIDLIDATKLLVFYCDWKMNPQLPFWPPTEIITFFPWAFQALNEA